jgi:hypothetical protein
MCFAIITAALLFGIDIGAEVHRCCVLMDKLKFRRNSMQWAIHLLLLVRLIGLARAKWQLLGINGV